MSATVETSIHSNKSSLKDDDSFKLSDDSNFVRQIVLFDADRHPGLILIVNSDSFLWKLCCTFSDYMPINMSASHSFGIFFLYSLDLSL